MTSSNGNIFRVTCHLCGEFTGHQWRGALMFYLIYTWINGWVNNREAGDLRRYRGYYGASVMLSRPSRLFYFVSVVLKELGPIFLILVSFNLNMYK